jgi:hypothetical protein
MRTFAISAESLDNERGPRPVLFLFHLDAALSTTALFTAAGIARVDCRYILPAFFCGRLITDGTLVYTGKYAATTLPELIRGRFSWKTVIMRVAGLVIIALVLFIDWRQLLAKHRLKLRFNILAGRRRKH